jgi:hypothetical protein
MMREMSTLSRSCSMVVFALAVNMLMIDSQNAYKVMAFLFLFAGYTYATRLRLTPLVAQKTRQRSFSLSQRMESEPM